MTRCATMKPGGRVMRVGMALFATLLVLASPARGEQTETGEPDPLAALNAYVRIALENNPDIKASHAAWQAAAERAPQVSAPPDPDVFFGYDLESPRTTTALRRIRFGLSQTMPWFGKLSLREKQAALEADAQILQIESQRLKVIGQVKDAFFEYAYVGQAASITRENIALMRYLEEVAASRYRAGLADYAQVVRLGVEIGKLEDQMRSLEDLKRPVRARLNATMNRPSDDPIPLPERIPLMVSTLPDQEILAGIESSNPDLKTLETMTLASQAGVDVARREYYPDVTVELERIQQASRDESPTVGTISINLPIWVGSRGAAVREAEQMRMGYREQRYAVLNDLTSAMQLVLYKYRDAGRKIDLYQGSLLPKAEQALGATLQAFQSGTSSALDLVDAQRTLLEFQLSALRALADQGQRMAEMETLLGREIPCRVHGVRLEMNGAAQTPKQ